jgi:hypothetical protein
MGKFCKTIMVNYLKPNPQSQNRQNPSAQQGFSKTESKIARVSVEGTFHNLPLTSYWISSNELEYHVPLGILFVAKLL